ncbi:hypothetical protein FA13DRAFT_1793624 [Coprinellus micaceus]|uniref:Uncharacterized protein n=1 Tax=Coprinellus micaceus TaxID=71717 RepID=A0A4Y7T3L3_COPMI|nr:hypothetical protein FA13DRAFT_1793624 [Coprinellus micaceus]
MSSEVFPHISSPSSKTAPQGRDYPSNHAASSYYFTISLIFACAGLALTPRWAGTLEGSNARFPTCTAAFRNPVVCNLIYLPPVLSFATVVINLTVLCGLHIIRAPTTGSQHITTTNAETTLEEGGGVGHALPVGSTEAQGGRTFIPAWLSPRMPHLIGMWVLGAVFALTNALLELAPGTSWWEDDARGWLMVSLLALVQIWTLSLAAFIDRSGGFPGFDGFLSMKLSAPMSKARGRLLVSLAVLHISLLLSESHFPFLRLLIATSLFDMGILCAINIHEVKASLAKHGHSSKYTSDGERSEQTLSSSHPSLPRGFFVGVSTGALALAVLWVAWAALTALAETLSIFGELSPDRRVMQVPTSVFPKREYPLWGYLEAGVDTWQGLTLGRLAVYAWRVSNCGKGRAGLAASREP